MCIFATDIVDIQGLVALKRNVDLKAMYIAWMCTAPQNNPQMYDAPKYAGVGGHLFAIAGSESMKSGFGVPSMAMRPIRRCSSIIWRR